MLPIVIMFLNAGLFVFNNKRAIFFVGVFCFFQLFLRSRLRRAFLYHVSTPAEVRCLYFFLYSPIFSTVCLLFFFSLAVAWHCCAHLTRRRRRRSLVDVLRVPQRSSESRQCATCGAIVCPRLAGEKRRMKKEKYA